MTSLNRSFYANDKPRIAEKGNKKVVENIAGKFTTIKADNYRPMVVTTASSMLASREDFEMELAKSLHMAFNPEHNRKIKVTSVLRCSISEIKERVTKMCVEHFGHAYFKTMKNEIVFYPAHEHSNIDGLYDDVQIIVRKLNNSETCLILLYDNFLDRRNWRQSALRSAWKIVNENIINYFLN